MQNTSNPVDEATGHAAAIPVSDESRVKPWHVSRWANVVAGLLYFTLFAHIYESYISPVWGYTGLNYADLTFWEQAFQATCIGLVSYALPQRMERASAIILWLLYAFVFVPTIAITFMIGINPSSFYRASLLALSGAMILCCWATSGGDPSGKNLEPAERFVHFLFAGFIVMGLVLFISFRSILSFASIDDIYVQRFAAAEIGGGLTGYFRTYFSYVFSPAIVAFGLMHRRWGLVLLGTTGYLLSYMIDAAKIALVIPLAVIAFYAMQRLRVSSVSIYTFLIAIFSGISSLFTEKSLLVRYFVDLLLLRTIAIPGQTFSQYYDLFESKGYTFWSNTKGIDMIVPPPAAFQADRYWPVLGQIVGAEFYGEDSRMNANANLFAGEGVAAAGPLGVIVIGCVLALWLRMLDNASRDWNRYFVFAVTIPVGVALTNIHLTTLLLSFGGFFWLLGFRLGVAKPGAVR